MSPGQYENIIQFLHLNNSSSVVVVCEFCLLFFNKIRLWRLVVISYIRVKFNSRLTEIDACKQLPALSADALAEAPDSEGKNLK